MGKRSGLMPRAYLARLYLPPTAVLRIQGKIARPWRLICGHLPST